MSLTVKIADPFDDSVGERHKRMGLLDKQGNVDSIAVEKMTQLHAGLFYDLLCDVGESYEDVISICCKLIKKAELGEAGRTLFLLSLEYDMMHRFLPEAIWWISGSMVLLEPFMREFGRHLGTLIEEEDEA